jgi:apolipoprotein N-acyltransferase
MVWYDLMPYFRRPMTTVESRLPGPPPRRSAARGMLALLSAALYAAAFPPIDAHWAAPLALAPLLLALRASTPGQAATLGVVWSLAAMSAGITDWLVAAAVRYFDQPWHVGAGLLLVTTLVGASVEYGAVCLCHRAFRRRFSPAPVVLLTASAWVAAELCRTRIGFGNPWGLFGYAVVGDSADVVWSPIVQVADLGGVYAVTFVLVAINATLVEAAAAVHAGALRTTAVTLAVGATVVGSSYSYGRIRLTTPETGGSAVSIAIVQGNLDLGSQWNEGMYGANLAEYLELTGRVLREHGPGVRTVFWPENAMTFFVDQEPGYRTLIGRVLTRHDLELVAGAPRFENRDDPMYYNAAFVFDPDGEISGRYDKRRLMPFAEYFPLSTIDLLRRNFGRVRVFTPAPARRPPASRAGTLGILICNEAIYPQDAGARAREGAEILVNLSNDSWVEGVEFAEDQLRIATLRAIEQRRWLVRASTSGPSAIIAPTGRLETRSSPHTVAVLTGEIRPRADVSVYGRYGDAFACSCLGVTLAALAAGRRRRATRP